MIRESPIPDLAIDVDAEAVVIRAERPLRAVSSAIVGGGLVQARAIVNLHVPKGFQCADSAGHLAELARRRAVPTPFVGLLTGAATDKAELATEHLDGLSASVVVTVGLSNRSAAGRSAQAMWRPSTINTIVIVDATPEDAALVNLVITATEAKTLALAEAGISTREGGLVTGTRQVGARRGCRALGGRASMSRRPWIGVSLSVTVHAAVLALVVVSFSRDDWLPVLVVDLRDEVRSGPTTSVGAPAGEASGSPASPPAPRRSRAAKRGTSPRPGTDADDDRRHAIARDAAFPAERARAGVASGGGAPTRISTVAISRWRGARGCGLAPRR